MKIAKMILSTMSLNMIWYAAAITNSVVNICENVCSKAPNSVITFFVYATSLVSDLNSAIGFIFQCVFSSLYRQALKKVFAPICGSRGVTRVHDMTMSKAYRSAKGN